MVAGAWRPRLAAVLTLAALVWQAAAFACTPAAVVVVDPAQAPAGAPVEVSGTRFEPTGKAVTIALTSPHDATSRVELALWFPDGKGSVGGHVTIPAVPPGDYVVSAEQTNGMARVGFRVLEAPPTSTTTTPTTTSSTEPPSTTAPGTGSSGPGTGTSPAAPLTATQDPTTTAAEPASTPTTSPPRAARHATAPPAPGTTAPPGPPAALERDASESEDEPATPDAAAPVEVALDEPSVVAAAMPAAEPVTRAGTSRTAPALVLGTPLLAGAGWALLVAARAVRARRSR